MKKSKKPKSEKDKLEEDCLDLWSLCVKTRDRKCMVSGKDYDLQGHHIRSRTHKVTYLDIENGMALTSGVHCLQKFNPEKFHDLVIDVIGAEEYDRLKEKSGRIWKPTVPWLKLMKEELTTTLKRLEGEYGKLGG